MSWEGLFIELMRVSVGALWSLSRTPSYNEWRSLYNMAESQSLVGVCFAALQYLGGDAEDGFERIGMSEEQYLNWMADAAHIHQRNEDVNYECIELQKHLSDAGFRSCILKGQGVAQLYGALSTLRQSGDIDVWVDASKEKIIDFVMQSAPTKEFDQKHIHCYSFVDTDVEMHWMPVKRHNPVSNRILEEYFDSERERQFSNIVDGLCVPTPDFQLVHQLMHVYGHYVYEGVGMRQIMDLYFTQRACDNIDGCYQKTSALFKKLRLMRFVAATQWVLMHVFQMPMGQLLCEPDEKEGRKLLDEIIIGGNFGHHNERNHISGESMIHRFFRRWGRMFRMFRFDPLGTLIMPFSRLKLELWMRRVRRKYKVYHMISTL